MKNCSPIFTKGIPFMSSIRLQSIVVLLLLGVSFYSKAQPQVAVYQQTIDEINCTTLKLLLVSYDRPVAARSIQPCEYGEIVYEVKKVKENKLKGYKTMFLALAKDIEAFKKKATAEDNYATYAGQLEAVSNYSVQRFREICQTHQAPTNKVCQKLAQKSITLQATLNKLVNDALAKISEHVPSDGKPATRTTIAPPPTEPAPEKTEPATLTNDNETQQYQEPVSQTYNKSTKSSSSSLIMNLVIFILVLAVGWLYKENYELKEEVQDIKMLLKALTKRGGNNS